MKEVIKLKQQTPMWHFQSVTPGCCLRATEVKPKLDRFLFEKHRNDNEIKEGEWTVNGCDSALDYKLWFQPTATHRIIKDKDGKINKYPLFFGNTGKGNKKQLIFYDAPIDMHLFSMHDDLIKLIKKHLNEFFATNSFGTRQDKGFGFFFPEGKNFDEPYGAQYKFDIPLSDNTAKDKFVEPFKGIHYFHSIIRSGILGKNKNNSLMPKYIAQRNIAQRKKQWQWEKHVVKSYFHLQAKGEKLPACNHNEKKWLTRDVLGLASSQPWGDKGTLYVNSVNNSFQRFKSPITYRPVLRDEKCTVYVYLNEQSVEDFKSQKFKVVFTGKGRHGVLRDMKLYPDFTLSDYFDYIMGALNNAYIKDTSKEADNPKIENFEECNPQNQNNVTTENISL